ncbi:DUF2330 domain-containing protein [Streptomyces xiamenensis]|uniref:DUF2330 domain-containing protein n=1 Tax=Streptomyces xiamenensis TaxID=408015 RepID=UPI0037D52D43
MRTPARAPARTTASRSALLVLLLLATQLVAVAWPAYACGCGGMVTGPGQRLTVEQETSAVRWDGETEQIVMSLTVAGDAAEAAWIMPVPSRAEVSLGDPELFDELWSAAAPEYRDRFYFWPRSGDWPRGEEGDGAMAGAAPGTGAPPVGVVSRDRLGPFDVARLTATDPTALEDWLRENGFTLPADMAAELTPYVEQEWEYVALRLAPDAAGEQDAVLGGTLDPISLTFASDELVYPMRLSRLAETEQLLTLYVLSGHRMEPASTLGGDQPEVTFAGRLTPAPGPLRDLAGEDAFLTVIRQEFARPGLIEGDHVLRRTAEDTEFRRVYYDDRLLHWFGVPAWQLTTGAVVILALVPAVWAVRQWRRRKDVAWS